MVPTTTVKVGVELDQESVDRIPDEILDRLAELLLPRIRKLSLAQSRARKVV